MCIDFKNLNSACPNDYYLLPNIDCKVESVMGFINKCLLNAYKGYHQIQMEKKDEEKTAFHTDHGTYCYKKMPFGLKNAGATYQRRGKVSRIHGNIRRDQGQPKEYQGFGRPPVLSDFLSEVPKGEKAELYFWMPEVQPERDDIESWTLFTDGASNSKGSRIGLSLIGPNGIEYTYSIASPSPALIMRRSDVF
nr:reverse transcriptase domain-containing protein [Tanacetum cinerariifolium]